MQSNHVKLRKLETKEVCGTKTIEKESRKNISSHNVVYPTASTLNRKIRISQRNYTVKTELTKIEG